MGNESPTKLASADTTRLVRNEWVLGVFRRVLRRLPRHSRCRGLVAGVLASVVHGRRVGEGTACGQWGRVRVFLGCGIGDGGGPLAAPLPWVPAFARTTVGGSGGTLAGTGGGVPHARRTSGYRLSPVRRGVGSSRGGGGPAPRPCPGFPLSRERRWGAPRPSGAFGTRGGCWWRRAPPGTAPWGLRPPRSPPSISSGRTASDSCLRRNDARRRRPRAAPLPWVPAFAGTTVGVVRNDVCGTRGGCWWRRALDRLRANGNGAKRACDVGWWGRAAARRTSGYRLSPVRRWRVWEVREAEAAPRRAPALGSRVRGNDGGRGVRDVAGAGGGGGPFDRLRANGISISL